MICNLLGFIALYLLLYHTEYGRNFISWILKKL
jgi:hypothetical protein